VGYLAQKELHLPEKNLATDQLELHTRTTPNT